MLNEHRKDALWATLLTLKILFTINTFIKVLIIPNKILFRFSKSKGRRVIMKKC